MSSNQIIIFEFFKNNTDTGVESALKSLSNSINIFALSKNDWYPLLPSESKLKGLDESLYINYVNYVDALRYQVKQDNEFDSKKYNANQSRLVSPPIKAYAFVGHNNLELHKR